MHILTLTLQKKYPYSLFSAQERTIFKNAINLSFLVYDSFALYELIEYIHYKNYCVLSVALSCVRSVIFLREIAAKKLQYIYFTNS